MKRRLSILMTPVLLMVLTVYGQDSIRTRNDKPGTPQSLRTPDQSPQSHVKIINTNTAPNQPMIHGAPESNKVNNTKEQIITTNSNTTGNTVPTTPITIINAPPGRTDTNVIKGALKNGISNASNPIRNK